eukprot:CAMPEP_0197267258 /NCGR_PEP_ID=MMETSP1432-20130617/3485_2 /TAXON_ID=44447 /ORGANISM="Pseudo-nitzschia delicatissima, Strain UNC1205" /LENGTH=88 /DNA_ID=CAMNT_0042732199 /DNA_START=192 /DNA_END=455 /DNA_ORIENTATION=-
MISPIAIVKEEHLVVGNSRKLADAGEMCLRLVAAQWRLSPNLVDVFTIPVLEHQIPDGHTRKDLQEFQGGPPDLLGKGRVCRRGKTDL